MRVLETSLITTFLKLHNYDKLCLKCKKKQFLFYAWKYFTFTCFNLFATALSSSKVVGNSV